MKAIILIFVLILTQKCGDKSQLLQGKWVDTEDENSSIRFEHGNFYMFYNSDTIQTKKYEMTNVSCDTNYYNNKNIEELNFLRVEDGTCYEITGFSDSILAYRHTVSGKLHVFRKH